MLFRIKQKVVPVLCILGCLAWCVIILCIIAAPGSMMLIAVYRAIFRG